MNAIILTDEEENFMEEHNLKMEDFYDGRGESKQEYHENAKDVGCNYVIHNYCRNGHRLKTRSGHCIICNPAVMAFQRRCSRGGAIYVASCGGYSKVGVVDGNSFSIEKTIYYRENSLNGEGGYGGVKGWKIVAWFFVDGELGRIENEIHKELSELSVKKEYYHDGSHRVAQEVLKCSSYDVIDMVDNYLCGVDWVFAE